LVVHPATKTFRPRSFDGWALEAAVRLDSSANGANFLAFLFCTSALRRQAIFAALSVSQHGPEGLASRLRALAPWDCGACPDPYQRIARALVVTCRARHIIHAIYGDVPDGLVGVLNRLGDDPLPDPEMYKSLFEIFSRPENRQRAKVLCQRNGTITATHIQSVQRLDPVLVHENIVKRVYSVSQADTANSALALVRATVSTATNASIRLSVENLQPKTSLSEFFSRWLSKMDRSPVTPPIPSGDSDFAVLTTGEAMSALGRRFRNCAEQKVPLVAVGSHSYIEWRHEPGAIAECRRTTEGKFVLVDVHTFKNERPSPAMAATIRQKLEAYGIAALSPGDACTRVRDVLKLLGVWDRGGDLGFEEEIEFDEGLAELEREF
jgi:hypothetical protein